MKNAFINVLLAACATMAMCFVVYMITDHFIRPCILQGDPRPAGHPSYCDATVRLFNSSLSITMAVIGVPFILFVGCLLLISRVRSR